MKKEFAKNVFINCPFDQEYLVLLRAMLFTILYLGYYPRIASERFDSAEPRIQKIIELIKECKFGIHDISRIRSREQGEFYRLNMPFELGLDMGAKVFCDTNYKEKKYLILEKDPFRYRTALSDLSSMDIKSHKNTAKILIRQLRNWFVENGLKHADSASVIWYRYNDFISSFYSDRKVVGFSDDDIYEMPIPEFINSIKSWLKKKKNQDIE